MAGRAKSRDGLFNVSAETMVKLESGSRKRMKASMIVESIMLNDES